jgi:ribosomal protein S18 acetylase RimI-like enzyme
MPYHIRPALPADAAGLARVRIDTWRAAYLGIVPDEYLANLDYASNEQNFRNYLTNPAVRLFAALDEVGQAVGFANSGANRETLPGFPGEVYALYILPAHQKHGLGRALLRRAFEQLADGGLFPAVIWVLADNPACGFYRRVGGEEIGQKLIEIGGKQLRELCFGFTKGEI